MSDAVFSDENVIRQILKELDCSIALFACYQHETSISAATIERSLAGKRRFDPRTEAQPLARLARELRELQKSYPIRLDWRDVPGIRSVLSRRREQEAADKVARERQQRVADIENMSDEDLQKLQEQIA